jgi:F420-non-reducing hydrogenase iron-sulfur subunit
LSFEPKIIGFLCNWCSYAGADLAGVSRFQYPTNMQVIRVMCSGRIDPIFIIKAFETGFDGVAVMGCHLGDCHYLDGNYEAKIKILTLKKLLSFVGLDERLMLEWVSAAEGLRFSMVVKDFTEKIRALGPNPLKSKDVDPDLLQKFRAIARVVEDFRIRTLVGKKRLLVEFENVYGEKILAEEFDSMLENALKAEFIRNRINLFLKEEPMSVKKLAGLLKMDTQEVLNHVVILKQRGLVALDRIEEVTPLYLSIEV